jgi:hypothetical protein
VVPVAVSGNSGVEKESDDTNDIAPGNVEEHGHGDSDVEEVEDPFSESVVPEMKPLVCIFKYHLITNLFDRKRKQET